MTCTVRPNHENDRQQPPNFSSLVLHTNTYTTQIATYIGTISAASRQSRAYLSYVGPISVRCWLYWLYALCSRHRANIVPMLAILAVCRHLCSRHRTEIGPIKISHVVICSKGLAVNIMLLSFINVNVYKANLIHIALIVVNVISREFGRV